MAAVSGATRLTYANKMILAPMVRIGTLPSRLLAIKYGADIVYTEELIDHKMVKCKRVVNDLLSTVDFVGPDGKVVLRTCAAEKDKVVFQMGTANAQRALKTARLVADDVAGIDINMGCPKEFSIKGGMGAALLSKPDTVRDILTTLVQGLPHKPITCKIRLLPTEEATLDLVRLIESTGVAAIAVHGRLQSQRPREPVSPEQAAMIRKVVDTVKVPVIANGGSLDIKSYSDIAGFLKQTGCSSVMIARSAQWNMSVFRPEGLLDRKDVVCEYLQLAAQYDNPWQNSKYCLMTTLHDQLNTDNGELLNKSKSLRDMCAIWNMEAEYAAIDKARTARADKLEQEAQAQTQACKRQRLEAGAEGGAGSASEAKEGKDDGVVRVSVAHDAKKCEQGWDPKSLLFNYCRKYDHADPVYVAEQGRDKQFRGYVRVLGGTFGPTKAEPNKRKLQQTSALACLTHKKLNPTRNGLLPEDLKALNEAGEGRDSRKA